MSNGEISQSPQRGSQRLGSRFAALIPRRTDRALIVGQTGSGKTTLAERLLRWRAQVVVVDHKGLIRWPGYVRYTRLAELTRATAPRLVYAPGYEESQDEEMQERLWEWLYRRGHTTVYVDETATATNGDSYPYYYGACLMRGREHGTELWSSTQRPMRIPQIVISESEHVYAFRLRLPQDRRRLEDTAQVPADAMARLAKREFLYAQQGEDVIGPLQLSL